MGWGRVKDKLTPRLYSLSVRTFFDNLWHMQGATLMREVIKEGSYGVLPPGDSYDDTLPIKFVRATELKPNLQIDVASCHRVAQEYFVRKARIKAGDVLLAVKGATIASKKSVAVIPHDIGDAVINGSIFRMQFKEAVMPKFAAVVLDTPILKKQMRLGLVANNGVDYLDKSLINKLVFPVPNMDRQLEVVQLYELASSNFIQADQKAKKLIASIDDHLLDELGITLPTEPDNTIASRIFATRMRELEQRFDPAYFSTRFSQIQHALEAMPHSRLREVVHFSSEQWDQVSGFGDEFPYLEISAINTATGEVSSIESISKEAAPSRAKMLIREGDILVSTTRPNRGAITHIGSGIQSPLIASTGFSVIRHVVESKISKEFLLIMLRSRLCLMQFEQRSSGGNYPAITQSELGRILLPSVAPRIQDKIVAHVVALHAKAKHLRQQAEAELDSAKKKIEALLLGGTA